MRIAFVCNEYPPKAHGGIGTFVQTLAWELQQRGHEITVVGLGESEDEYQDGSVRIVTLREDKRRFVGHLISRLRLRNWLGTRARAGKIDIVEVPDYQGLLPFRVNGSPVVVRLHLTSSAMWSHQYQRVPKVVYFYERQNLRLNARWIGVSQHILDLTKNIFGIVPEREVLIYNPVPSRPTNIPRMEALPRRFVLYAGLLSERKGALVLAEAARGLLAARLDLHLVFVGGDSAQNGIGSIKNRITEIVGPELGNRVHFLGRVEREKVIACMERAEVFAFPSTLEALPLVVLEAMNCGTPVVCTKLPPGPEIVEDGVNGMLADPASPEDFGVKIACILDDPSLANRLSSTAQRRVVERFSLQRCVEDTETFYRECLANWNG
jgi:starch synthase